jgi:hypothetical protein
MMSESGSLKPDQVSGEARLEYRWAAGGTTGEFLQALRDYRRILGAVCGGCGMVAVPPLSYCEICGGDTDELREVGPRGVVTSWARVIEAPQGSPVEAPFRYVLVLLEGADTALVHLAPDDDRVDVGVTVVPEFREGRSGAVTDIKWFVPEG